MPVVELPDGQNAEFPDSMSQDDIRSVLQKKFPPQNNQQSQEGQPQQSTENKSDAMNFLPPWLQPNMVKDFDAGIVKGAQNLGSGLLEAGEYLTRKGANQIGKDTGHPVDVPYWNARKFMGLEGENPINLGSYISKNPNKLAEFLGQYGPSGLSGGTNALRQMLTQGAFGASQASPDQQNAFGLLPSGRGGAAIQDAALAGLPFAVKPAYKMVKNSLSDVKNIVTKIDPRVAAKSIQQSHDILDKTASDIFDKVGDEAVNRGVDVVPIRNDLIDDISSHYPKTKNAKKILNDARNGDYQGLRDLQADLFQRGTKAQKSPLISENNAGDEMMDLRDEINDSITDHFKNTGHKDLADELNNAKSLYKKLKDTYYSKKVPSAIKDLVHPESRKIPENIMDVLSQESKPMERIHKENPNAVKELTKYQNKEKSLNSLKNLLKLTGAVGALGGLTYGGKMIYHHFNQD